MAAMGLALTSAQLATFPSRLAAIEHRATTVPREVGCDKIITGGTYLIEVNGTRYECTGADSWCPYAPVPVPAIAYDQEHPERCRVAHNVQRLSRWEWASVFESFGFWVTGLALLLMRENDPNTPRRLIGHTAFLLAIAVQFVAWKFQLRTNV
ncbi:MAG: hypothetical protein QM756_03255 [Polyangiaceae bacterium]